MAHNTYYAAGQYNFYCDLCGRKRKSTDSVLTWDGRRVCRDHQEARNPQDYVRGVKDEQGVPWSRPQAPDTFVGSCTIQGNNAIAGWGTPGCMIPAYVNMIFLPSATILPH